MVGAVVLAAGAASRYGSPKQRVFLPRVLEALHASVVDEIVVVAGAHELDADAAVVHCPEWQRGPGASLRCGLRALGDGVAAAVIALADGPNLDARAVDRVIAAWREQRGTRLAATYDGASRSHPVLLARSAWPQIPDAGARALSVTLVPCTDLAEPGDVDMPPSRVTRY
jgi:CTP:molybdopterin cytidylyltransferase MocA